MAENKKKVKAKEEFAKEISGKDIDAQLADYGKPVKQPSLAWGSQRPEYELYPGE